MERTKKRPVPYFLAIATSYALAFCELAGCASGSAPTEMLEMGMSGPGSLTVAPMKISDYLYATPLGNLNPPGHTLPTDHVYFYWVNPDRRTPGDMDMMRPMFAPGSGVVSFLILPSPPSVDSKIMVKMTNTFSYYLDHVMLDSGFVLGSQVRAGQRIGTTSPQSFAIDLGVINDGITLTGFVNPSRYPYQTIHTDSPYKYFTQPLRDSLYATVQRIGNDKDGKIDYDIPGKLVGGWFLKGLPPGNESAQPDAWPKHLAFVYDMTNPTSVRISIGGVLSMRGVYAIGSSAPSPADISVSSGPVGYKLYSPYDFPNVSVGLMMVQMIANDTIKVETFPWMNANTAPFDTSAAMYTR